MSTRGKVNGVKRNTTTYQIENVVSCGQYILHCTKTSSIELSNRLIQLTQLADKPVIENEDDDKVEHQTLSFLRSTVKKVNLMVLTSDSPIDLYIEFEKEEEKKLFEVSGRKYPRKQISVLVT